MAIDIATFDAATGGNAAYKALSHPLVAEAARPLIDRLAAGGTVAIYDPAGLAAGLAALHDLSRCRIVGVFAQRLEHIDRSLLGHKMRPVTELPASGAMQVLVAAFDADKVVQHIAHLVPPGAEIVTLDSMRLPDALLTNCRRYLDPMNFATNFAFFRDGGGQHTRLVSANYWSNYGEGEVRLWCRLIGGDGTTLATWDQQVPPGPAGIIIDSRKVRAQFGLGEFTGQLFLHAIGARGHDTVKYALDTFGDRPEVLSCTHDSNAWPSELYAGLPAPRDDERVILWLQNSHPEAMPEGAIRVRLMGQAETHAIEVALPPFGSHPLDIATLFPEARWPQQFEIDAGKHVVRPRYEIHAANGRSRIAHVNVERSDLKVDIALPKLGNLMGKGFILPAPILPPARWTSEALPTPMSTAQTALPLAAIFYDADGREVGRHAFGNLNRADSIGVDLNALLAAAGGKLGTPWGHVELIYDFDAGDCADGWMHAIFRYRDRFSGHGAETSFGAHMFNTVLAWKGEPQSYSGPAPGLSTRLFLRLGPAPLETFCHLVYPASTPWHVTSTTDLVLHNADGGEIARRRVEIACSGSLHFRYGEMFTAAERARVGDGGYVLVRDTTCRLFGYHGLMGEAGAFSLDHMFGF
jgi:hypothetical protein